MKNVVFPILVSMGLMCGAVVGDDTPLGEQMELIDDAYKGLKRVEDAAAGVKDSRAAQAAILKAVTLVPEMVGKMPDGPAKEKAIAEFKQQLGELFVVFCKAELMFLAGETGEDKVDAMIDAFKASKKKAHDQFIEEDE